MAQNLIQSVFQEAQESFDRIAQFLEDNLSGDVSQTQQQTQQQQEPLSDYYYEDGTDDLFSSSPLQGMAEDVLSDIMSKQNGPESFWEHLQAFHAAINWSEPFILCLIAFHVLVFSMTIYMLRRQPTTTNLQLLFLAIITITCRMAGRLNTYGQQHWEEWGITQNYFDSQGFFIATCLCLPLIFICLIVLINMLREAGSLLIQVNRMKIKQQIKQQQQQPNNNTNRKKSKKQD